MKLGGTMIWKTRYTGVNVTRLVSKIKKVLTKWELIMITT